MVYLTIITDPGSERSKFLFTLRDSPSDYVNVTCWGSEEYIKTTSDSFKICDVGRYSISFPVWSDLGLCLLGNHIPSISPRGYNIDCYPQWNASR